MGDITINQILAGGGIIVGVAVLGYKLWGGFKTAVSNAVADQFALLSKSINDISSQLKKVDMEACKNFLVRCISDFENDQPINETEVQRFWEQYDHYVAEGHNGYIMHKVDLLEKEGRIKRKQPVSQNGK